MSAPENGLAQASKKRPRLVYAICALVLAVLASHRGAPLLGDAIGESLGRLAAPSPRRTADVYGVPPGGALPEGLTHDPGAPEAAHPEGLPHVRAVPAVDAGSSVPARTRGIYVPGSVVMAYARRGVVPAVDSPGGVVLRGVPAGSGLVDGDVVVRVGRANVRSVREISSIVSAALFAGHTHVSGTVRRGEDEIDVTVEIPTGADAGPS